MIDDPVLMAVVEALWDEMGMIADDATCMGILYAALLSERHRAEEAMRERAGAKVAEALAIVSHLHGPAVPIFTDILDAVANDIRSLSTED